MQIIHDKLLLLVSNLITNTFDLKLSEQKRLSFASKIVYCRLVRVEYTIDTPKSFELLIGFTDCVFEHLLSISLPEIRLIHEGIDRKMLCDNIVGLVIFKLYDDIRSYTKNFEYYTPCSFEFSSDMLDKSKMMLSGMRNNDCCLFVCWDYSL